MGDPLQQYQVTIAILGLTLFSLGLVIAVRAIPCPPSQLRARLLALSGFGFLHASFYWAALIEVALGSSRTVSYSLGAASFAGLFVFATVREPLLRRVVSCVAAAGGLLWLYSAFFTPDRYVFEVVTRFAVRAPAAICAAMVLLSDPVFRAPTARGRLATTIAAMGFGIYAVLQLWSTPAPFFPASVINSGTFIALFGISKFAAQTFAALLLFAGALGMLDHLDGQMRRDFRRREENSLAALRASEARLAEAQRIGNMGSWEWNINSNDLIWSDEIYRIFGFDKSFAPTYGAYLERIHPDDRELLGQAINNAVFDRKPFRIRHRIVRPNGDVRTLIAGAEVEFDDQGLPVKMVGISQDVTERVKLEEDSEAQRLLLRSVLDGMYVFVGLLSTDGILIDVNRAAAEATGHTRDESIGKPLWETYFWGYSPEAQDAARSAVERAAVGEVVRGDYVLRLNEETLITVDVVFTPLRDRMGRITQIVGSGVDVTERVKIGRAIQQSSFRLEQAQRIANIGSWEWDFQSGAISWSEQCYRIVGWNPADGEPTLARFLACTHPDDREKVALSTREALAVGVMCDYDHRVVLPNGDVRVVHQLGEVERDAEGQPLRLNGTTQDVTEWRATSAELIEAKQRAEEANLAKSRFLANMSHELRTPLNAIIGFSELLKGDMAITDEKRCEYATDIHSSGKHLLSVINDILDISRIEAGRVTLDEDTVCIADVVETCLRMARARAEEAAVELVPHVDDHVPTLKADRRLVLQTVLNLVSNAVKFSNVGGRVDVRVTSSTSGEVAVAVVDSGIGMSAEDVKRVGEPFLQIDGRHARNFEGTGLGLVIAKRLIELHGGSLVVESELGKGTTMTIVFPAWRVTSAPAAPKLTASA